MNRTIEERFVQSYIVPGRRERLLFELHGKRRSEGVGRFCHRTDELLIQSKVKLCGQYITEELQAAVSAAKQKTCYVISYFEDLDGREIGKHEVLNLMIGRGMPSIAVFEDFAILETEQESGPAVKYLLVK